MEQSWYPLGTLIIQYCFIGNARKKDKYKRMKQQEAKKELKKKGGGGKAGGKVTPFTGTDSSD